MLGFFTFTEVTDPSAHEAYNAWHQLDHMPEQFTIEGITFGQRWVRSPRCRSAEAGSGDRLEPFHYMTLYLMRDTEVLPPFQALGERLWAESRFFRARRALLSGPFEVVGAWAAPRVAISAGAVPFRPAHGVAGAWQFRDQERTVTVAFVDSDLWHAATELGALCAEHGPDLEWAGPLERVDAFRWDWFATLTPQ